jgi:hypothetical protein
MMKKLLALILWTLLPVVAANGQQEATPKVRGSASLPSTCTPGGADSPADTIIVAGVYYYCDSPNQWVSVRGVERDNTWSSNARFKGPVPYRDVSAYMPAGGCAETTPYNGADTTGTISLSTPTTLSLTSARDFKNGCGIAIAHAGPSSALPAPPMTATVSTASRSGTTVTLTFSGAAPAGLAIPFSGVANDFGLVVSSCSVSAYNGTFQIQTDTTSPFTITYHTTPGSDTASSCKVNFIFGYAHGVTGSTIYNYKIVAIDQHGGYSPASSTLTISEGNAVLTKDNYNWIAYPFNINAYMYALYSDKGLGGALTCVNVSFTMAVTDGANVNPCPEYLPTNPPASAGAQFLNTTIISGAGTTTLKLAASATNAVTSQNVYHDESSFINQCIADEDAALGFAPGIGGSDYGCYIPPGWWGVNAVLSTATQNVNGYLPIHVAGALNFQTMPWFVKYGYQIYGVGGGGQGGTFSDHTGSTRIQFGKAVPAGFVLRSSSFGAVIEGFMMQYVNGTGVWMGATDPSGAVSGVKVKRMSITLQGATGNAPCFTIDNNNIGVYLEENSCQAVPSAAGMPAIYVTHTAYCSLVNQFIFIRDTTSTWHTVKMDDPGGNCSGAQMHNFTFDVWGGENNFETGFIQADGGPNAPGTPGGGMPITGITFNHVVTSDGGVNAAFNITSAPAPSVGGVTINQSGFGSLFSCSIVTTCPAAASNIFSFGSIGNLGSYTYGFFAGTAAGNVSGGPVGIIPVIENMGGSSGVVPFSIYLTAPTSLSVQSTGSGNLAANTYCVRITAVDAVGGETDGSMIRCQAVGANSSIVWDFTDGGGGGLLYAATSHNFYYCVVANGTSCTPNRKLSTIRLVGDGGAGFLYTFSTTSGSSSSIPPINTGARVSWIANDRNTRPWSCFFCVGSNSDQWPIGIGMLPTNSLGINLFLKLGMLISPTTVGALPAASAKNKGAVRTVSDSTAISSEGQICVGNSSNAALAFSTGSVWKCF